MGLLQIDRGSDARADELRTLSDVARTYAKHRSPQIMFIGMGIALALRVLVGGFGRTDLIVVGITLALTGVVEWVLHLFVLHAPDDSIRMTKYKTGAGHREHHLDPPNIGWLMLGPPDVAIFLVMLAVWNLTWPIVLALLLGAPVLGTYLSAVLLSYVMLAHYEWTHLLAHARYRPRLPYYRRLSLNHRLHHYRNEHYWLGVTSNVGDRLLKTPTPQNTAGIKIGRTALGHRTYPLA